MNDLKEREIIEHRWYKEGKINTLELVSVREGRVEKGKEGEGMTNTKDIWKQHTKTYYFINAYTQV